MRGWRAAKHKFVLAFNRLSRAWLHIHVIHNLPKSVYWYIYIDAFAAMTNVWLLYYPAWARKHVQITLRRAKFMCDVYCASARRWFKMLVMRNVRGLHAEVYNNIIYRRCELAGAIIVAGEEGKKQNKKGKIIRRHLHIIYITYLYIFQIRFFVTAR